MDEAEAALLALGGRLQWREVQEINRVSPSDKCVCSSQKVTEVSSFGMQWYEIWHEEQEEQLAEPAESFVPSLASELAPNFKGLACKTLAAAKAACERHHAIGEWD